MKIYVCIGSSCHLKGSYDIIAVLKKYVPIASEEDVEVNVARKNETSIMEVSVSLDGKDRDDPELDAPLKSQTKD